MSDPAGSPAVLDHLFAAACSEMAVGQMIQCETFSLFEAMSAVEVGNPKMDAGTKVCPTAAEFVAQGAANTDLSPAQQLAIMERLLQLEASHYCMATPLAASVYTSLYMAMDNHRLQQACPLLAAFCQGLQQSCIAVRWIVFYGAVSEEEDFSLMVAGLPLEAGAPAGGAAPPDAACLQPLAAAIQSAQRSAQEGKDAAVYDAIATRLTFRRELHAALCELHRKTASSLTACHVHCSSALSALSALAASPVPREALDAAPGFVPGLNRHLLGPAPPRTVQVPESSEAWAAMKTMLQHLQDATHVMDATGFREVQQWVGRFAALRAGIVGRSAAHFLVAGSAWASAAAVTAHPSAGAKAQQHTSGGTRDAPGAAAPAWSLDRPLLCEALALPVSPSLGEEVELFLEQAAIAVGNWAQAMLLNPCRQRRRLRRGLDDWANLYQHALNADLSPGFNAWMAKAGWQWVAGQAGPPHPQTGEPDLQGPLATWVAAGTASSQLLHLLLGWELELYSPPEYCCLFWYCNNLLTARRNYLHLMLSVQAPAGGRLPMLPAAKPGKAGKAKAAAPPLSPATQRRQAGLMADAICAELAGHMCSGLTRLMLALQLAGIISEPTLTFNTQRDRFDQRYGAFHAPNLVRPDPLLLEHFQEAVRADGLTAANLLGLAAQAFAQLRRDYSALKLQQALPSPPAVVEALSSEQLADLTALDKVAATNTLAAMVLARAWEANPPEAAAMENGSPAKKPAMAVTFDFSQHPAYPTLKVKSAT